MCIASAKLDVMHKLLIVDLCLQCSFLYLNNTIIRISCTTYNVIIISQFLMF